MSLLALAISFLSMVIAAFHNDQEGVRFYYAIGVALVVWIEALRTWGKNPWR